MPGIITTFQPTFVQKLLGKNYKWWYFLKYKFNSRTTSVFDNALFVVGQSFDFTNFNFDLVSSKQ